MRFAICLYAYRLLILIIYYLRYRLLQVVNYNVDNYQYVVAGERGQLNTLALVLNELKRDPVGALAKIGEVITKALAATQAARDETGYTCMHTHARTYTFTRTCMQQDMLAMPSCTCMHVSTRSSHHPMRPCWVYLHAHART